MSKRDIEAELTRLRTAAPTTVASFAARRAARIAELEAALLSATDEMVPDSKVEKALGFAAGGDRFDRRRP